VSRYVSSSNQTAAEAQNILMALAVDLDFASGHVRAHDGIGTITIGANTYEGIGTFGSIEAVEESIEVIAKPLKLTLSGVDSSIIAKALTETTNYQNRSATLYFVVYNTTTYALVDTPETLWEGRMNQMAVSLAGDNSGVSVLCEHRLRREPRVARYTHEDQQLLYSGDLFFNLIGKIRGFRGTWGAKGVSNDGYVRTTEDLIHTILDRRLHR
jgi:hypothetical protein